jgi:HK97 gp10 family phage protein
MEDFNHLDALAKALTPAVQKIVTKTAMDIQASAASSAPVDTGFLRNSIYNVTPGASTYGQGASPTHKGSSLLPEVGPLEDNTSAYVAVGANYGVYLEYGTRHMPAQPYFYPAVDQASQPFIDAMSKLEDLLRGAA